MPIIHGHTVVVLWAWWQRVEEAVGVTRQHTVYGTYRMRCGPDAPLDANGCITRMQFTVHEEMTVKVYTA